MKIYRASKDKNYTKIDNRYLRDSRLSEKTIGVFTIILSLPDTWDFTVEGFLTLCKDRKTAVRSALKELEQYGYLTREQKRDSDGRMGRVEYTFYEVSIKPPS